MSVLSPALLCAVGLVLLASAISHLRSPAALRQGLRAHGVLPTESHTAVSLVLGPVEAALGSAALVAGLIGPPLPIALAVSLPIAALFLCFAVYLWHVLRIKAGQIVPCTCGLGEAPVSPSTVGRAGILAVMAAAGGATAAGWEAAAAPLLEIFVALAAALVLALSAALLPAARAVPEAAVTQSGGFR